MSSFTQLHNTSWWKPWVKNSSLYKTVLWYKGRSVFSQGGKIPLDYSYAGLDIQETLQVVSFLVFCQKTHPGYILCTHTHAVTSLLQKRTPLSGRAHPQIYCVKIWSKSNRWFLRYSNFCILPLSCFFPIWPLSVTQHLRHGLRTDTKPQQLIIQSVQATADAIASALTARTASIRLPVYDWNSQDAYPSFSIFHHTLENWLLLNCILPDSEDHLRYVLQP